MSSSEKYLSEDVAKCITDICPHPREERISIEMKTDLLNPVLAGIQKNTAFQYIDRLQNFDQADNVNRQLGGLGEDFIMAITGSPVNAALGFRLSHDRYDLHHTAFALSGWCWSNPGLT